MVYYCDSSDCMVFIYVVTPIENRCPCCWRVGTEVEAMLQVTLGVDR
jgi:hypothetical protein